jgi:hypothetical protein
MISDPASIAQKQVTELFARLTSQQSVKFPYQLDETHPSKHAQSRLFEPGNTNALNGSQIDSKVVLACFGEVVVFQRILVDVAGGFIAGVVLSQLLDILKNYGVDDFFSFADFLDLAERRTGIGSREIEDTVFVMDDELDIIAWKSQSKPVQRAYIGIDAPALFSRLKHVVSEQAKAGTCR